MPHFIKNSPTTYRLWVATLFVLAGVVFASGQPGWAQSAKNSGAENSGAKPAAQSSPADTSNQPEAKPADVLAVGQGEVADRFKQLTRMMLHLSEFSANSAPHRATVLKQAISETEQKELALRFEAIVKLLEKEQFALAEKNQTALRADLEKLLQLLLKEDRANRVDQEKKRIEGLIKEVGRIIKDQRGVKARTEGGDNLQRLTEDQEKIDAKAKALAEQIAQDEAESKAAAGDLEQPPAPANPKAGQPKQGDSSPSESKKKPGKSTPAGENTPAKPSPNKDEAGKPDADQNKKPMPPPAAGTPPEPDKNQTPGQGKSEPKSGEQPAGEPKSGESPSGQNEAGESGEPTDQTPPESDNERVRKRIEAARQRMEEAQKRLKEAERKGATKKQQEALDELEQAKAELEKILKQLREEEVERVLAGLEDRFRRMLKDQIAVYEGTKRLDSIAAAERGRDDEIEAGRLSRLEAELVSESDKALNLLKAEGSAVAFPEAVTQMRDDMELIAGRLSQFKTAKITQGLEEDAISALEEMIEALKRAQKELEEQKNQDQPPPSGGQPGDQALIDALAELRMIRALQMRVNNRTQLYSGMIAGEQADSPELIKALDDLSERQLRIQQVTRDLHLGKNK